MKPDFNKIKEYVKVCDDLNEVQNDKSMVNVRETLWEDECQTKITIEKGKHISEEDWDALSDLIFKTNKARNQKKITKLLNEKEQFEKELFINGKLK